MMIMITQMACQEHGGLNPAQFSLVYKKVSSSSSSRESAMKRQGEGLIMATIVIMTVSLCCFTRPTAHFPSSSISSSNYYYYYYYYCYYYHYQSTIDTSQPFRFTGIPNNATIDLTIQQVTTIPVVVVVGSCSSSSSRSSDHTPSTIQRCLSVAPHHLSPSFSSSSSSITRGLEVVVVVVV